MPLKPEHMTISKALEKRAALLRPMAIPGRFESEAKNLFEETCCGSRSLWPLEPESLKEQTDLRTKFYRLAHEGMWAAQERFLHRIENGKAISPPEEALYRTAMDTIAWQMLQRQLCFARRLYRDKKQPSLANSNLQSVVKAAQYLRGQKPDSMPLISDLTTFVQIGDILTLDPCSGLSIVEVKEGEKNHEIGKLASFYRQSQCENFKQIVSETETPHAYKQFERMLRQMDRMEFVSNVLGIGRGRDPDSALEVTIPEPYIPMDDWDKQLNALFVHALDRGWAIDVIDGCLFVGCYADEKMRAASPFIFLTWLEKFAGGENSPIARLVDCLSHPLALPLYAVPTLPDRMMDVMFGRLHICMGISLPGLVDECEKCGITVRPPNKGERKAIHDFRHSPIMYKGKPLVLERDGNSKIVADGVFMRSIFHFQRPMSVINAMLDLP